MLFRSRLVIPLSISSRLLTVSVSSCTCWPFACLVCQSMLKFCFRLSVRKLIRLFLSTQRPNMTFLGTVGGGGGGAAADWSNRLRAPGRAQASGGWQLVSSPPPAGLGDFRGLVRLIPGLGRSPGDGKSYPLQYSGLENSMGCIGHRVGRDFHFHLLHL